MTTKGSSNSSITAAETPLLAPEAVVEQLRALRVQIPEYTQLPMPGARALRRAAAVNPLFATAAVNTMGASETIQSAVGRTAEDLRVEESEIARWTAVEDELRAMLKGVAAANLVRRHRHGLAVLQAYNIGVQLVRHKDHAQLLPHVDGMKRIPKFVRRTKAPAEAPPVPAVAKQ